MPSVAERFAESRRHRWFGIYRQAWRGRRSKERGAVVGNQVRHLEHIAMILSLVRRTRVVMVPKSQQIAWALQERNA